MDFSELFPYVIAGVIVVSLIVLLITAINKKDKSILDSQSKGTSSKNNQNLIIKNANRRLSRNPNDVEGLLALGEVYFNSHLWEKSYDIYTRLSKIAVDNRLVDSFKANLRVGLSAMALKKTQEAVTFLESIYKQDPHNYELNLNLGKAFYLNKNYEKAVPCFKKALVVKPDSEGVYFYLGQCFFYCKHYRDALACYKKALDEEPNNKEALFNMAVAMTQENHGDKSIKIFEHLRPDSVYGPQSCLEAGTYHSQIKDMDSAIADFEMGLKHDNASQEIKTEIQYKLAQCYFVQGKINEGLGVLKSLRLAVPNYKDVDSLISRYSELSQNTNLQIYLTGGQGDFVALCRKFVAAFFASQHAQIKIQEVTAQAGYTDITAEISTIKWEDFEVFRFFRTTGVIGELPVRELHGYLQDIKADKGVCISAGMYSDEAQHFIEGRPLDLIDKAALTKILKTIS